MSLHSKTKGKSTGPVSETECCRLLRRRGSGGAPDSFVVLPDDGGDGENSNSPSPLEMRRLALPLENSRASFAVAALGASRWTRNQPELCSAFRVSEGRFTLKETTGSGERVTVLKEDTVIPRNAFGPVFLQSVAVMIATGCGTCLMRIRICSERLVFSSASFSLAATGKSFNVAAAFVATVLHGCHCCLRHCRAVRDRGRTKESGKTISS